MSAPSSDDAFARANASSEPPVRDLGPLKPSDSGSGIAIGGILVGIFVLLLCGAVPVLLLLPAVGASREAARRNGCLSNMRCVAMGVGSVESSMGCKLHGLVS